MIEQARQAIKDAPVPWDDLRERRVLAAIEATKRNRRRVSSRQRPWLLVAAAGAVAAAAVIASIAMLSPDAERSPQLATVDAMPALQPPPAIPFARPATMALADGSQALLKDGAQVEVDVQSDELVRLVQRSGSVKYRVAPNPAREFVVDAGGARVQVIGTVFTVSLEDDQVAVMVQRGRVAVQSGDRTAELGVGDELRVDAEPETLLVIDDSDEPAAPDRKDRPKRNIPSADELLAQADTARAGGRLSEAAGALRELITHHGKDPRTYASSFQLGKVERARGRHAAAAKAFTRCYRRSPTGALSEDARAEAAVSWQAAGKHDRAKKGAADYVRRYPSGAHAARMRRILDRKP